MPKTRTSFKKGEGGRPKGSKNKSYMDASHWLGLAHEIVQEEKESEKKFSIVKWATELIMSKVPALPATPGDSVANAIAAQAIVNQAIESHKDKMVDQLNVESTAEANSD